MVALLAVGMLVGGVLAVFVAVDKKMIISGVGSTFVSNIVEQWKADFKKSTGVIVSYIGVGSGAGRSQLINGTVDFAGSDTAVSVADAFALKVKYGNFVYIPEIAGDVAITYNFLGSLVIKFTSTTIVRIFVGDIINWNSPTI